MSQALNQESDRLDDNYRRGDAQQAIEHEVALDVSVLMNSPSDESCTPQIQAMIERACEVEAIEEGELYLWLAKLCTMRDITGEIKREIYQRIVANETRLEIEEAGL